jgi:hypothetical protein
MREKILRKVYGQVTESVSMIRPNQEHRVIKMVAGFEGE